MRTLVVALVLGAYSTFACAKDEEVVLTDELRTVMKDLMVNTKVKAVADVEGPAENYRSDDDPMTLEIVMLSKRSDGPSRVSDDGEVIFMQDKTRDEEQETLFTTAFYLKAQHKLAEPKPAQAPIPE